MIMKRHIFVIAFFCSLIFAGCERERNEKIEYERTIWVNPDVECCGIKDPLNNLEWLKELYYGNSYFKKCQESTSPYGFIYVFTNDSTQENYIVENHHSTISWITIYNCDGSMLDGGYYNFQNKIIEESNFVETKSGPEECRSCDEFFRTNTLIDTIAYYYNIIK
jgi:hypothetical protein